MKREKEFLIETCYHCGNTGQLKILYENESEWGGGQDFFEKINWILLKCPVCGMLTLREDYTNESMIDSRENQIYEKRIVYPKTKYDFKYAPKSIQRAFESAVKVAKIDPAICLLSLRRTLEMICKDKYAQGKTLELKIRDLVQKNILPATLDDSSWLVRNMGNDAAHADAIRYTEYEVEQIIEFVEQIITYLYELPERITILKKTRQKRLDEE